MDGAVAVPHEREYGRAAGFLRARGPELAIPDLLLGGDGEGRLPVVAAAPAAAVSVRVPAEGLRSPTLSSWQCPIPIWAVEPNMITQHVHEVKAVLADVVCSVIQMNVDDYENAA